MNSNIDDIAKIELLNSKFKKDPSSISLNDFRGIESPALYNKRANQGVLNKLTSLLDSKELSREERAGFEKLAAPQREYMNEVSQIAGSSESGITGRANMNWLKPPVRDR